MKVRFLSALLGAGLMTFAMSAEPVWAAGTAGNLMQLTIQAVEHMAGMPVMPPHTVSQKVCMSAKRFDPEQMLRKQSQTDCKITNYKMNGKVITFDETCTQPAAITSHGEFHLGDGPNFTGTMHTEMSMEGHAITVDTSYTGERVGSCTYTPKAAD
jgi:hypothetical protein